MEKRVISAIIMIGLFIPFLILGGYPYLILVCVLGLASLWELMRQEKDIPLYMKIISFVVCMLLIIYKYNIIKN